MVTGEPEQTGFTGVLMVMETGSEGTVDNCMVFEVAGLPVLQRALDVRMQDTRSLLDGM